MMIKLKIALSTFIGVGLVFLLGACSFSSPFFVADQTPSSTPPVFQISTQVIEVPTPTIDSQAPEVEPMLSSVKVFPDTGGVDWKLIQGGFKRPIALANAGDGSGRLFVVEQAGIIRIVFQDVIQPGSFLDISSHVGSSGNEQGLLGLAFHPAFKQNGFFYVNYTDRDGNTVIARFHSDVSLPASQQTGDPASELILLRVQQPYSNHNGGYLAFGPDHMLWIGLGDGGSGGDPQGNGQSIQTFLGKLLRIDVDHGDLYAIPSDNPFAAGGGLPEIWAFGLRNPWRFTFDSLTGDLYIGDVGQNQWEEIDFLPAGFTGSPANFGWNIWEGTHPYQDGEAGAVLNMIAPIFEYQHNSDCSVTGGEVYRGNLLTDFYGIYLFGDYCSGTIRGLLQEDSGLWQEQTLFSTPFHITSFGVDEEGELYLLDMDSGLYRLEER
jgi:glucose/arabinose dehydrogenase